LGISNGVGTGLRVAHSGPFGCSAGQKGISWQVWKDVKPQKRLRLQPRSFVRDLGSRPGSDLFGGVESCPANSLEKIWETRPTDSTDDSARWNGCNVSRSGNDVMTIRIWRSDLRELPLERLGSQVEEPAWELVTPRIKALNR
jgi:hypothetical protein